MKKLIIGLMLVFLLIPIAYAQVSTSDVDALYVDIQAEIEALAADVAESDPTPAQLQKLAESSGEYGKSYQEGIDQVGADKGVDVEAKTEEGAEIGEDTSYMNMGLGGGIFVAILLAMAAIWFFGMKGKKITIKEGGDGVTPTVLPTPKEEKKVIKLLKEKSKLVKDNLTYSKKVSETIAVSSKTSFVAQEKKKNMELIKVVAQNFSELLFQEDLDTIRNNITHAGVASRWARQIKKNNPNANPNEVFKFITELKEHALPPKSSTELGHLTLSNNDPEGTAKRFESVCEKLAGYRYNNRKCMPLMKKAEEMVDRIVKVIKKERDVLEKKLPPDKKFFAETEAEGTILHEWISVEKLLKAQDGNAKGQKILLDDIPKLIEPTAIDQHVRTYVSNAQELVKLVYDEDMHRQTIQEMKEKIIPIKAAARKRKLMEMAAKGELPRPKIIKAERPTERQIEAARKKDKPPLPSVAQMEDYRKRGGATPPPVPDKTKKKAA